MGFLVKVKNRARLVNRRLRHPLRSEFDFADVTEREWKIIRTIGERTMTSPERLVSLIRAVDYVARNQIPGDIVECGVYRGGSVMAAAMRMVDLGETGRGIFLYDTFEGMPAPAEADRDLHGRPAVEMFSPRRISDNSSDWARAAIDEVRQNVYETGYPRDQFHFVVGMVEDTLPQTRPESIALLRLDTDWYESTRHELEHLFPLLVPGGVLIIDDYGHYQGAAKAVDEYLQGLPYPMHLSRVDYSARLAVKPPLVLG